MNEILKLKYGTDVVEIPVEGADSIEYLNPDPMPEIADLKEALRAGLEEGAIGSAPLRELVSAADPVTIVVSDITRSWMHQAEVLNVLGAYLHETIGVPFEQITVLIALGTHRKSGEKEMETIVGPYLYGRVTVLDHDCDGECTYVGTTSRGTEVRVNPLAVSAEAEERLGEALAEKHGRKVIVVGGTVHHMMAGFGGGRKNILPGVSSRETIRQNHRRALDPNRAHSDDRVDSCLLKDNPIHEDMDEAAALAAPTFSINIVVSTNGKHSGLFCGALSEAWLASCDYQKMCYEKWIDYEADIVVVSCGGAPKDMNLYQGCKSMLNAMRSVKEGGQMIWLCKCPEGCGAPDYTAWLAPLKEGRLDPALRADFTIGGFIFYLTVENLAKAECRVLTLIDNETAEPMGMKAYTEIDKLMEGFDFHGKSVYVIPYGGSVVPMLNGRDN